MATYTVTRNELTVALRRLGKDDFARIVEEVVGENAPITLMFKEDGTVETPWTTYGATSSSQADLNAAVNEILAMRVGGSTLSRPARPNLALWIGGGVLAVAVTGLVVWHFSKGRKRKRR